jgi:hypothetical protein
MRLFDVHKFTFVNLYFMALNNLPQIGGQETFLQWKNIASDLL